MNWITTTDKEYIDKWQEFISFDENSSFVQNAHRVQSYKSYGMSWELLICVDESRNILLGSANVIVKLGFFKIYVCSCGPTFLHQKENNIDIQAFFENFMKRAKALGCFASQISVPKTRKPSEIDFFEGSVFSNIASARSNNFVSLISLNGEALSHDGVISSFTKKGRRDVRASYRKGLSSRLAVTENEIREAYLCIENNAASKGYEVRNWESIKTFLIDGIKDQTVFILTAWLGESIQGAVLVERSGKYLSYSMGGVKRHSPDLLTGYFLQSEAMALALELGMDFYDVSCGGPDEVKRFKSSFNPVYTENYKSIYFVHDRLKERVFSLLYRSLKSHVSKLVSIVRFFK